MEEQFLTVEQVSKVLQLHPFTVLKYIKQEKLKGIKLGRRYRIKKSDVNAFLGLDKTPETEKKELFRLQKNKEQKGNVAGDHYIID
ncbi:MAG: helix-turn-helix domain-containing protein [Patescibacteria group bacterium]